MKKPFKAGDRVIVYGKSLPGTQGPWAGRVVEGKISSLSFDTLVESEYMPSVYEVHSKQCRRLKPKRERRRLYMTEAGAENIKAYAATDHITAVYNCPSRGNWIEFIEVRRK